MELDNWIMIVDDNPMDQKITMQLLKNNHNVRYIMIVDNGKKALSYLKTTCASAQKMPKFILLDLDMPEMNGLTFLEEFTKFKPVLKNACEIVVITASKVEKDLTFVKKHPEVAQLILKPLTAHCLNFIA